jgi:hypothetical protein
VWVFYIFYSWTEQGINSVTLNPKICAPEKTTYNCSNASEFRFVYLLVSCDYYIVFAGRECRKLFNKNAMEKIVHIMQDFNDLDVQTTGCRIIAQAAIGKQSV